MISLSIDGRPVQAEAGETLLVAARRVGIEIPTLCHVEGLAPYGSCFICMVQIEGRPNLVPACSTPVAERMIVTTESDDIAGARRMCLELLFSDHIGDCYGPCLTICPCNIDIPGFVSHLAQGEREQAAALIKRQLPQPASLGRVCPRPCEDGCRRSLVDEPIAICSLKRYAADGDPDALADHTPVCAPPSGRSVVVVGAGPAGVAAAYYLALAGHSVRVLDANEAPGGMMRYGIPSYRLPRDVIDREVAVLERMGVRFAYRTRLGDDVSLDELRASADAVFLALGAWAASEMQIEGESLPGVSSGIDFLARVSRDESLRLQGRVLVVGGGNTAIDAARTALRCGAESVSILYRRTRAEMPAYQPEIDAAEREGVALELLVAPVKVERNGDTLRLHCIRMGLGAPDSSGRRRPVPIAGSEHVVEGEHVIAAIGQKVADDGLAHSNLGRTRWGTLEVNPHTLQTNLHGVFAGGDCVSGADIAVRAAAAGHTAAIAIDQLLRGQPVVGTGKPYRHAVAPKSAELEDIVAIGAAAPDATARAALLQRLHRQHPPELAVAAARQSFGEVEQTLPADAAIAEAKRCLACGCRAVDDCAIRRYAERYDVNPARFAGATREVWVDDSHPFVRYESHKCILCASCVRVCEERLHLPALALEGRGFATRVRPPLQRRLVDTLPAEGWEPLVEVCPTGALSRKDAPVAHR